MKVIRDGVCYVDFISLINRSLTRYMDYDKKDYTSGDIVSITNPEGFRIISERKDILDYDDVKDLTSKELDLKVKRVEKKLEPFINKWISTPYNERDKLYKEKEYKERYEKIEIYYYELIEYRANRDEKDDRMESFLNSKKKVKKL